jgi:hypothetical protein
MKKSKTLKSLKIDVNCKIDSLLGDFTNISDVIILCDDKQCLLDSISNKIDKYILQEDKKKVLKKIKVEL